MRLSLSATIALIALLVSAAGASADCKKVAGEVREALSASATTRYDALFSAITADASCDPKYRALVGRTMARSLLTTLPVDSPPAAIAASLRFGRPWQVLVAIGDAYYDRQDWGNARDAYGEALTDMADKAANPSPPPDKAVERVYRRAVQAGALTPATDMFASRGAAASAQPAGPIVLAFFASGSAELSDAGKLQVKTALPGLQRAAARSVIVIGHADASEAPALAEARAQAVARYLDALGYAGRIETVGKGSSEPFVADEPERFSDAERQAFDRRVEFAAGD